MTLFGYFYHDLIIIGSLMNEVGDVISIFAVQLTLAFWLIFFLITKRKQLKWREKKSIKIEMIIFILLVLHFIIRCFVHDDEPRFGTGFTAVSWMAAMAEGLALNWGYYLIIKNIASIGTAQFSKLKGESKKADNPHF
jgi:DMSO/TMAO reductase YedYZ heme-binding membrane subunit